MDTALPQKFLFFLDRNLAKAKCTENHVCTSCDKVVLGLNISSMDTNLIFEKVSHTPSCHITSQIFIICFPFNPQFRTNILYDHHSFFRFSGNIFLLRIFHTLLGNVSFIIFLILEIIFNTDFNILYIYSFIYIYIYIIISIAHTSFVQKYLFYILQQI